jgi:hypothetical protein
MFSSIFPLKFALSLLVNINPLRYCMTRGLESFEKVEFLCEVKAEIFLYQLQKSGRKCHSLERTID